MYMSGHLKNFLRFILDQIGWEVVHSSRPEDFHDFLARLQPFATNFSLVRVGGVFDGGYLIPDDLEGLDAVYSPGVAESSDFESFFLARGVTCFLADNSVDSPPIQDLNISFEKKHLGLWNTQTEMTLENWVLRNTPDSTNLLLQMDIEGAEWTVLTNVPDSILAKFRIVVVEFHNLHKVFNSDGMNSAKLALDKLSRYFDIVHLHPNNGGGYIRFRRKSIPRVVEITFIRKDRVSHREKISQFPHELDSPNLPMLPDFYLSPDLFRK